MKNILFVDDEQDLLDGLRRILRPMRHEWNMVFEPSPYQALESMETVQFDVIISDMRMPGMDGIQLLSQVMQNHPHTVRIALSGQTGMEMLLDSVRCTHQFLSKPCDAETIKSTIDRACNLRDLFGDNDSVDSVNQIKSLPSLPALYMEIVEKLHCPETTVKEIGDIVAQDIGMSAKMLQLVNSSYFGLTSHISSPSQAATMLGIDVIKSLVLADQVFSQFDQDKFKNLDIDQLWEHSLAVGGLAKQIAATEKLDSNSCDHALMAGLLHDLGRLILTTNLPEEYEKIIALMAEQNIDLWQAEEQVLGYTHMEVGAYLLGLWGLPNPIIEALSYHHRPTNYLNDDFVPLSAVHIANALITEKEQGIENENEQQLDLDYCCNLQRINRIPKWRKLCDEMYEAKLD